MIRTTGSAARSFVSGLRQCSLKRIAAVVALTLALALSTGGVPAQTVSARTPTSLWTVSSYSRDVTYYSAYCRSEGGTMRILRYYYVYPSMQAVFILECRR